MLFTSEFNKLLWALKRKLNITHKRAYWLARTALQFGYDARLISTGSIFDVWSYTNARAAAGHCWGLSKAYDEVQDKGRAIAFKRAAQTIYNMVERDGAVSFAEVLEQKFIKTSIELELVDFYLAAHTTGFTPRTVALITEQGAHTYAQHVHTARWF